MGEASTQGVYVPTNEVLSDEPATYLAEFNYQRSDGRGISRFQVIHIVRPNHIAEFKMYLGPAHRFTANGFQIYGGSAKLGTDETVASLRDWADELRDRGGLIVAKEQRLDQDSFMEHIEERSRRQRHQSTFGPSVKIERK
jgi:hypothetical protein